MRCTPSCSPHEQHDTVIVHRDVLFSGHRLSGPAVIVEATATTVVPPGYDITVDAIGSLIVRAQSEV